MELVFTLSLPRDQTTVRFVRALCRSALEQLGVSRACISDIEIVVTESCTNVLRHAADMEAEYEVGIRVDESGCEINVVDAASAFDAATLPSRGAALTAEGGRGVFLMRALVDDIDFVSDPSAGTVVRLQKALELTPDSVLAR